MVGHVARELLTSSQVTMTSWTSAVELRFSVYRSLSGFAAVSGSKRPFIQGDKPRSPVAVDEKGLTARVDLGALDIVNAPAGRSQSLAPSDRVLLYSVLGGLQATPG